MSNITKISVGGNVYDIKDASVASAISSAIASEASARESADAELGSRIDAKANSADVYTKTQVDTSLSAKADASTTYTKTEVDTALSGKANSSHTHTKSQITDLVVPTKTSELTNDSGFTTDKGIATTSITAANAGKVLAVNADGTDVELTSKGTSAQDVAQIIGENTNKFVSSVDGSILNEMLVDELPAEPSEGFVYFVKE